MYSTLNTSPTDKNRNTERAHEVLRFGVHDARAFVERELVPSLLSYVAEVRDVVARGLLSTDPEEDVLRPLVVGAPDPKAHRSVGQEPPEVGLPDGLYGGRVQVPLFWEEYVLQLVGLAIGLDELQSSTEVTIFKQNREEHGREGV